MGEKNLRSETDTILFLIPSSDLIPSGKVRVLNYLPYLRARFIKCKVLNYHHPLILKWSERINWPGKILFFLYRIIRRLLRYMDSVYQKWIELRLLHLSSKYQVVMIQWEPPPVSVIRRILKRNPNLIFDYDDAVFLDRRFDANYLIAHSKMVIAGNEYLRDYGNSLNNNVVLIPSGVPIDKIDAYRENVHVRSNSGAVIGWIGSQSTLHHLEILNDVFEALVEECPLQLVLIGTGTEKSPVSERNNLQVRTVKFYNEDEMIRHLFSFTIGIVPFKEGDSSRGKTVLKALIYMAAGIPVVCSPVKEYSEIIEDGVNGFLAFSSEDWVTKLRLLINNKSLRREMGNRGLALVREKYSTEHCFKLFYESLKTTFGGEAQNRGGIEKMKHRNAP